MIVVPDSVLDEFDGDEIDAVGVVSVKQLLRIVQPE